MEGGAEKLRVAYSTAAGIISGRRRGCRSNYRGAAEQGGNLCWPTEQDTFLLRGLVVVTIV